MKQQTLKCFNRQDSQGCDYKFEEIPDKCVYYHLTEKDDIENNIGCPALEGIALGKKEAKELRG